MNDEKLALERICTELEVDQGSPEFRKTKADHLVARFRRYRGDSDDDLSAAMRELVEAGPAEPRFEGLLSTVVSGVRHHVQDTVIRPI
ncbi:hypothetical protein ACFQ1S_37635 [Kibdelosporangium lantanae]|uniref:Uncharacterized protein n=1 Tax=Kibdelosporangium lantanae TaxID=1497396 RepID=A0ABW3MJQ8_9PSEU